MFDFGMWHWHISPDVMMGWTMPFLQLMVEKCNERVERINNPEKQRPVARTWAWFEQQGELRRKQTQTLQQRKQRGNDG